MGTWGTTRVAFWEIHQDSGMTVLSPAGGWAKSDLLAFGLVDEPSHSGVWKTPARSDRHRRDNAEKETMLSGKMPPGGQAILGGHSESYASSLNLRL